MANILGDSNHNLLLGSNYGDVITGLRGNDVMHGEAGDDVFTGQTGDGFDQFFGGVGSDKIDWDGVVGIMGSFSLNDNSIEEIDADGITSFTSGSNTLDFRGVTLKLNGGEIHGGTGHNTIYASNGDDFIRGGRGDDTLHGMGGNDTFRGASGDGFDIFWGGAGTDRIVWDGDVGLMGSFGAGNSIEEIEAATVTGRTSSSSTLDFSRTALTGVTLVRGDNGTSGIGHNTFVTSLSRIPGLVYDGGGGNDRVTVTIAPVDFDGSGFGPLRGLIKDISESRTANFDTGFTFDDSLGLTVRDFEQGLSYGWFTLADELATASLANVRLGTGTLTGTTGNDLLIGTSSNIETYLGGDGDDLIVHASSNHDRIVTGAGDDTIIVVGNRSGRINHSTDTATPDTGLDQMFVINGDTFTLGGELRGIEHIEFLDALGAGRILSSTGITPDFTHTTLVGVNLVRGGNGSDTFITAREHHKAGGDLITYDGGTSIPYDKVTVSLGDFTQIDTGSGLRNDLSQLVSVANNVSVNGFTFDTAFDGFGLRIQNIGDNRPTATLDLNAVSLGYIGHDDDLVTVSPTAARIHFGSTSGGDVLWGSASNDIWLRGANANTYYADDGDDLIVGFSGSSVGIAVVDGQRGSDTYLATERLIRIEDTGGVGYDRLLAVKDGAIAIHSRLEGIEEINANGFDVELRGSGTSDVLHLEDTLLIGIDTVSTRQNADTIHTSTKEQHVTYNGGSYDDTLHFYLTGDQAEDESVQNEIAAFNAAGSDNWTFDELGFTIVSVETVVFDTLIA